MHETTNDGQPWVCTPEIGHACEMCQPEQFPEFVPRPCPHKGEAGHEACTLIVPIPPGVMTYPPPVLSLDGVEITYYWRGYRGGPDGWMDVCGQLPGVPGVNGLHVCPCTGTAQCHHRLRGHVTVAPYHGTKIHVDFHTAECRLNPSHHGPCRT